MYSEKLAISVEPLTGNAEGNTEGRIFAHNLFLCYNFYGRKSNLGGFNLVLEKTIKVKINNKNINYYRNLGYDCSLNNEIDVLIDHLPKYSKAKILIKCDYCNREFRRAYYNHLKQAENNIIKKDSCVKCAGKKRKESNLIVYGVDNTAKLESVKQKMKFTLIKKYGVDHQMKLNEIKEKIKNTNLKNMVLLIL